MTSTTASAIRPGLRDNRALSGSPHTPSRFISPNYSSPGSTFRQEDDAIVLSLDPRRLFAGFEGESGPQCAIPFAPDASRRLGDYRPWLPGYKKKTQRVESWSSGHELWRNDLKDVDLGLLTDKLERTVREAYNKYLLVDAGSARLVLVLPSLVPHPVLSSILTLLFERWKYASITLLPAPIMSTVAAGLRSALVVDIGWEETVVTPVYEYRELPSSRSCRAMKSLVTSIGDAMKPIITKTSTSGNDLRFEFDMLEDLVTRMAFCNARDVELEPRTAALSVEEVSPGQPPSSESSTIQIDWPNQSSSQSLHIPKSLLPQLLIQCLLSGGDSHRFDDHELPIGHLVYNALLGLSSDVRAICISRIIFTGDGSAIPGLQQRILEMVESLMTRHGWTRVRTKHLKQPRAGLTELAQGKAQPADARHDSVPLVKDYVEEKVQKQRSKDQQLPAQARLRVVDTLGPWAGASLLTSLKVKGFVEIEREKFLSHGLQGASRDIDASVIPQRMSTIGAGATKANDRTSWTLAGWA